MSLDALLMLFGALVAVMPFLGFTVSMQKWIFFALGLIVIALGIAVRRRGTRQKENRRRKGEFVESIPQNLSQNLPQGVQSYELEARTDKHNQDKTAAH